VEKQVKLEEQRKAEKKKDELKHEEELKEGQDRGKKGKMDRWINYAMASFNG
jgi:hypothetical protein